MGNSKSKYPWKMPDQPDYDPMAMSWDDRVWLLDMYIQEQLPKCRQKYQLDERDRRVHEARRADGV